jgi:hypothetical protein
MRGFILLKREDILLLVRDAPPLATKMKKSINSIGGWSFYYMSVCEFCFWYSCSK